MYNVSSHGAFNPGRVICYCPRLCAFDIRPSEEDKALLPGLTILTPICYCPHSSNSLFNVDLWDPLRHKARWTKNRILHNFDEWPVFVTSLVNSLWVWVNTQKGPISASMKYVRVCLMNFLHVCINIWNLKIYSIIYLFLRHYWIGEAKRFALMSKVFV